MIIHGDLVKQVKDIDHYASKHALHANCSEVMFVMQTDYVV